MVAGEIVSDKDINGFRCWVRVAFLHLQKKLFNLNDFFLCFVSFSWFLIKDKLDDRHFK